MIVELVQGYGAVHAQAVEHGMWYSPLNILTVCNTGRACSLTY